MYLQNILNKSDCVIAPTKKVKEYLDHYNIDSEIKIVPTGIVRELPKQISESRKMELMEAYHIDPNKKILLSVGRLGTEKNLDELLMNMGDLVKLRDDVQMIIVGDGPYRKELEAMVKTMGLGEHILFTGMIAHDEINEIYQLGDLFVSASTSETQGLTVLEAMMNGLPLVCREDKSIDNVLVERVNGYTYKDRFVAVDCMNKLLSEPELHKAFSEDSKKIAKTFSTESFAKKISDIYKQASLLYNVS
jgi:1,2-diacylglycerol 3-alpha-glucosyltransferase